MGRDAADVGMDAGGGEAGQAAVRAHLANAKPYRRNGHAGDVVSATVADDAPKTIKPTPFEWPADLVSMPTRPWIYGNHYIRKYATGTVAPGAVGKSGLVIAEALSIASGYAILGKIPTGSGRVWIWNGEDPSDELERQLVAAVCSHGLDYHRDLAGRLFIDSGRKQPICIAKQIPSGIAITSTREQLVAQIKTREIDVFIVDPLISSHRVPENDNSAIDAVTKAWAQIADEANCAVELVHHVRKPSRGEETTVDDARGGGAFVNATRDTRVLNRMSDAEAERCGVANRLSFFRVVSGKSNLAPLSEHSDWYELRSHQNPNGDQVRVVHSWKWPSAFEEIATADLKEIQKRISEQQWREDRRAADWAGKVVAEVAGIDLSAPGATDQVKTLLRTWTKNGALKVVSRNDDKRRRRKFVEVGEWAA